MGDQYTRVLTAVVVCEIYNTCTVLPEYQEPWYIVMYIQMPSPFLPLVHKTNKKMHFSSNTLFPCSINFHFEFSPMPQFLIHKVLGAILKQHGYKLTVRRTCKREMFVILEAGNT